MPDNLMDIVTAPLDANYNNSVVAFKDNSSAIRGFEVKPMLPAQPGAPSPLAPSHRDWDLLLTAETHNFPCAVAPYPGESSYNCSATEHCLTLSLPVPLFIVKTLSSFHTHGHWYLGSWMLLPLLLVVVT